MVLPGQDFLFPSPASITGHRVAIEKTFQRVVSEAGLEAYFTLYSHRRPQQNPDYQTPAMVVTQGVEKPFKSLEWLTPLATFQQPADNYDDDVTFNQDRLIPIPD